ncbi:TraR/DksA C4-type zinc finger protein [Klebsiella pneumoniae]
MSAEIIDQANELTERRLEMTIQNMRINHHAVSATHCRDCRLAIPELRRKYVPGVTQCIDCSEYTERKSKQFRG